MSKTPFLKAKIHVTFINFISRKGVGNYKITESGDNRIWKENSFGIFLILKRRHFLFVKHH